MCLLFAKSGVELLVLTIAGKNQFWRWQSWVLVLGLIVCALLQLWYMHKGLVLANPTLICPCEYIYFRVASGSAQLVLFSGLLLLQHIVDREWPGLFRPILAPIHPSPVSCHGGHGCSAGWRMDSVPPSGW